MTHITHTGFTGQGLSGSTQFAIHALFPTGQCQVVEDSSNTRPGLTRKVQARGTQLTSHAFASLDKVWQGEYRSEDMHWPHLRRSG